MNEKTVVIDQISCGHCVRTIERELGGLQGVRSVKGDPTTRKVQVSWEPPATWELIEALLREINYPPRG